MSWAHDEMQPSPTAWEGWFEPTPEKLTTKLAATRERWGEMSIEYVSLLVQIGDAHMVQGRLSNPQAQASYESALKILQETDGETSPIAWVYDKLANVKQSSGDSFGAEVDLEKALSLWKENGPGKASGERARENHLARRAEDLENLKRLNAFKKRKPPEIEPGG
jgi:tetratricopeptide (TPR) repeat protein